MAKKVSIANNILFNGIVQVTGILLNIALMPYITGIFNSDQLGVNSFGQAVAGYFVLFGNLGVTIYGTRSIAQTRDDRHNCQQVFSRCISFQFFFNLIALVLFGFWAFYRHDPIYYLFGIIILTAMTDLSWAYSGMERFDLIAARNFIIKIVGASLIFIFVHDSDQLPLYILLQQAVLLISNLVFWVQLRKIDLEPKFANLLNALRYTFVPAIVLFLPSIFSSIYLSLNKVMLGYMSIISEVAEYDYPNRLVNVAITFVGVIGTVLMPRLAYLSGQSDVKEYQTKVKQLLFVALFCCIPIMFLFICLAEPLCRLFFHSTLPEAYRVLRWIAPTVISAGLNLYVIFVSVGRMKPLTICILVGGIINIILNILFIPRLSAMGAAISTLTTEVIVHTLLIYHLRDLVEVKWLLKKISIITLIGLVSALVLMFIDNTMTLRQDVLRCIIGASVYIVVFVSGISAFQMKEMRIIYTKFKRKS